MPFVPRGESMSGQEQPIVPLSSPSTGAITRRALIAGGAGLGLAAAFGGSAVAAAKHKPKPAPLSDVFQLGVASGEPDAHGVVLWTRLAMDPVALDGLGGMPDRPVPVEWQIAKDENFKKIVRKGVETARP